MKTQTRHFHRAFFRAISAGGFLAHAERGLRVRRAITPTHSPFSAGIGQSMKRSVWLLTMAVCLNLSTTQQGYAQTTLIDASRRIDWSRAGVSGGIPQRTTVCATLPAGASASQINNAIASCP